MPQIIKHIDQLAMDNRRDALYVEFARTFKGNKRSATQEYYKTSDTRKRLIKFLEENQIGLAECGPPSNSGYMGGYWGDIYIHVPFDENDADYKKVEAFLENEDGSMKFDDARFCYFPYEWAKKSYQEGIEAYVAEFSGWEDRSEPHFEVFLGDERDERNQWMGWDRVYSVDQAILFLETEEVAELHLDYDLGGDEPGTGYDVLLWLKDKIEASSFKLPEITVYSQSAEKKAMMEKLFDEIKSVVEQKG